MMPTEQALLAVDSRFPQKFGKISQFRGSRTIYIYKAYEAPPLLNYKSSIKAEVGGLGVKLFGSSVSTFEVTFPRNTYYPGEKVAVSINCDNSKCKTPVKCYKMKLFRTVRHRDGVSGHFEDKTTLVASMKSPGIGGGKKDTRTIELELPKAEKDITDDLHWSKLNAFIIKNGVATRINYANNVEYKSTFNTLTGSWLGVVYQIQYVLKVYVKHEGLFQFGAGRCVTCPLKILNTPSVEKTGEPYRVPEVWNPTPGNAEPAYLWLEENFRSKYFTEISAKNWAAWEKAAVPVVTKEDDKKGKDFAATAARRKSMRMNYDDAKEEEKDEAAMSFAEAAFGGNNAG